MAEKILGFQLLIVGFLCAVVVNNLTGANVLVSGLVGFIGGGALFGGLMAFAPRVMFFGLVGIYAVAGFSIARYFEWGVFETLVLTVAGAGIGWIGNVGFAQDMYFSQTPAEAEEDATPSANPKPIKDVMSVEDKAELLDDAAVALAAKMVSVPIYTRMCKEIQKMAGGTARADQPLTPQDIEKMAVGRTGEDDLVSITNLSELNLIRADEWAEIVERLDAAAPTAPQTAASPVAPKYTHVSQVDPADALFRLAEGRAISMETFLRAMLQVDPSYPPEAAKIENFPHSDLEPQADVQAGALFQAKLIDLEEFQAAIAVIRGTKSAAE